VNLSEQYCLQRLRVWEVAESLPNISKYKLIFKLITQTQKYKTNPPFLIHVVISRAFKLTKMKKQKHPYGCGLYAVANACNLENFITEERLEKSKKGNTIGQLFKWIQEDGHDFNIDTLYYNHVGKKLPNSALNYKPTGEGINFLPILINCRFSDEGKNHLIGGKISKDGTLFLYDSLKEEIIETTLKKVNKMYHNVYGLFLFMGVETGDYVFI